MHLKEHEQTQPARCSEEELGSDSNAANWNTDACAAVCSTKCCVV